jgi:cystathionine beta-lyase/cystathionine gamma-synthase
LSTFLPRDFHDAVAFDPDTASVDLAELRAEVRALVGKETAKLERYAGELRASRAGAGASGVDALLIGRTLEAVEEARGDLQRLLDFVLREDGQLVFSETMKYAGFAFRRSVAARTLLLRHTPTLTGVPHALDPAQDHRLAPPRHIIDYGRNAYLQFQESEAHAPKHLVDHPLLAACARAMAATLQGEAAPNALLFSSAMGAIDSLIDYMGARARSAGAMNLIGQRCWFEIRQYVDESWPEAFRTIDERDAGALDAAIEDPAVFGVMVELVANHPDMSVIDLGRVVRKIGATRFERPKLIVFDVVHTPDVPVFERWFAGAMPANLCVALVVSGVKFMQAGWDISKSGLLLFRCDEAAFGQQDRTLLQKLVEIRSVSGRAPSIEEACLADLETPASFASRLARYDRNTCYFARALDAWLRENRLGHVCSPWLAEHPGHEVAMNVYGAGGRVLFLYFDPARIGQAALGGLFKELAASAADEGLSLMAAPSFGLAAPHVHVVIRSGMTSSLRVSTGSTSMRATEELLQFFMRQLGRFIERSPPVLPAASGHEGIDT